MTTRPQVWLDGQRVGGQEALRQKLTGPDPGARTCKPVLILFAVAMATPLVMAQSVSGSGLTGQTVGWFVSVSMILPGMQKLRDVQGFSTLFLNYDLLTRAWVPYGHVYPWVETAAGVTQKRVRDVTS